MDFIVRQKGFWLEDDESVLKAIHEGFIQTHYAMWKELGKTSLVQEPIPGTVTLLTGTGTEIVSEAGFFIWSRSPTFLILTYYL